MLLRQLTMNLDEKRLGIRTGMAELNLRRMDATVRMLLANPNITVTELASECCLSRKQFERLFASLVGTNPKEYARIVRFQRALAIMQEPGKHILNRYSDKHLLTKYNETTSRTTKADDDISQASLAYACGYADQSHMIREFRALNGRTPVEMMKTGTAFSELFTNPMLPIVQNRVI